MHKSLYKLKECPGCHKPIKELEWISWCSKCNTIVCSCCVHQVHHCKDGYTFGIPGRGTRYFSTVSYHDTNFDSEE